MSKHNYSQYSNKKNNNNVAPQSQPERRVVEEFVAPKPDVKMMHEAVDTFVIPETVTGTVYNCSKLNVRAEPDLFADVVCVLDAKSEIEINVVKSTDEWFYICTAIGAEGYCMRRYVNARL